ncbi:MAG: polyamine ABC transporter substrate-binding protein [Lachnospiraceae bacterium]|jgi:spermidine/putrescine transport system substrate-binding protein
MKKRMKMISVLLAAALGMSLVTGCGQTKEDDGKELVLFTWEGMFPQEVLDGFEEKTGIKIVYSNFDTDETMLEKLSQAEGGDYDVVIADDYIIEQAVQQELAQKLDKSQLDHVSNINPLYQGQFYDPEDEYTVPYGAGIPLIVYNPEEIQTEITSYADLWNPEFEDQIALTANYRVINGITLLSMGKSMNEEDVSVIEEAGKKLIELASNVRMIQDDNTQNALLNGEANIGFLYTSQVTQVLAENPDLKVVYPEEGLGFGIMAAFVPVNAPNSEAAHQFLNYILEPEVSAECFNYIGYYCTTKAADELVNPELVVPDTVTKGEIIQNVSAEAEEVYNKNWTEFRAACD